MQKLKTSQHVGRHRCGYQELNASLPLAWQSPDPRSGWTCSGLFHSSFPPCSLNTGKAGKPSCSNVDNKEFSFASHMKQTHETIPRRSHRMSGNLNKITTDTAHSQPQNTLGCLHDIVIYFISSRIRCITPIPVSRRQLKCCIKQDLSTFQVRLVVYEDFKIYQIPYPQIIVSSVKWMLLFSWKFFSCFNVMLVFVLLLFHCSTETLSVGLKLYFYFT